MIDVLSTQTTGVVVGIVIAMLFIMLTIIVVKVINKAKADGTDVKTTLELYHNQLLDIAQLSIDLLREDKNSMSEEEYNRRLMDLTAEYFRAFLRKETSLPKFMVDAITADHMFDTIDYIQTIGSRKIQDIDQDRVISEVDVDSTISITETYDDENTMSENERTVDISEDLSAILTDDDFI